ncbi:Alpha/Beta hydrolase protein [Suillus ampliporus]|nr:Alpha/Beta hydrolase protein [Suillus ampliporus]
MLSRLVPLLATCWGVAATSASINLTATPTVTLDSATVTGVASGRVNMWLGIPFALPPTGDLRFRLPQPIPPYNTNYSATAYGDSCPQQSTTITSSPNLPAEVLSYLATVVTTSSPSSEDCLNLNVIAPADATPESKLPVVVYLFGGAFQIGGTSLYNGSTLVNQAIDLDVPAVYVSMNHRLSAFGFLASQEVKDAGVGNLGLQDQRQAMRWVQKYITAFGGDPTKVTFWGESSGGMSIVLHMVANGGDTEGLFRAAFLESGTAISVGDITHGQEEYDFIVDQTGCKGSSDTLQCLRGVPYATLLDVVNKTPNFFGYQGSMLAWMPRVDGVFLTANPQDLISQGSIANIPVVISSCDDEGTVFSLGSTNVTTDSEFQEYIQTIWLPNASSDEIQPLMGYYPADVTQGSPFDTGYLNAYTPQYKRIAAFQNDAAFQGPRRFFLEQRAGRQNIWSSLNKRLKSIPLLGTFHSSDSTNMYYDGDMAIRLLRFVTNLDPNGVGDIQWPMWTSSSPNLLTYLDGLVPQTITQDTYRVDGMAYLNQLYTRYPI